MSSTPIKIDPSTIVPLETQEPENPALKLQQSISYAAQQNPDQYAKLLKLKQQTGIPPEVAQGNESEVQHAADVGSLDYTKLAVDHPRTTAWASNPDNAAVAGVDEVQRLSRIEKGVGEIRAYDPGILQRTREMLANSALGYALQSTLPKLADALRLTPTETVYSPAQQAHKQQVIGAPEYLIPASDHSILGNVERGVLERAGGLTSGESLALIAATSVTGGLAGPAAPVISRLISLGFGAQAAKQMIDQAPNLITAYQNGDREGFFRELGGLGFDAVMLHSMLKHAQGRDLEAFDLNKPSTWLDFGQQQAGKFEVPFIAGQVLNPARRPMFADHLENLITEAEQSKLKERSPEAFHDAMQNLTEGDPSLRIPVDQFMEYFHSKGIPAQKAVEEIGVKNFPEALLSGGDVEVPIADYLTKMDAEHQRGLVKDVVNPESGLTQNEFEKARTEVESITAKGIPQNLVADAAQADAETASTPEYTAVREELRQRYVDAGETPEVAETLATKDANVFSNLAKSVGMKPNELLAMYRPKVKVGEVPESEPTMAQGGEQGQRGWFKVNPDGSIEIGKTSVGDLSTFVHEPAHGYLKIIGDLAKREGASEQIKGDYGKILDFLGAKDGEELTTEQQEKWARANEQYLREGKAPSEGLKGVFQRFAVWLSSIYKKASDLGVELTPEIRGVFDRLYAAEEGVNRAEAESGPRLFNSPEEAGWTEEQFQKYAESRGMEVEQARAEILAKLNEAALREKTEEWIREEHNVREAMQADVDARPEYKAIKALRKGETENGTELKLDREGLVKLFGEDRVKALQKQHPGLYRNEGGADPEIVAEVLGFESAGKMMDTLENTPRRSAAITEATKAYMTAKHGDIRYDGSLQDQARLAVENQQRAENLHRELEALNRRNNPEYELREAQRELKRYVKEQEEASKAKENKSTAKDMTSLANGLLKENEQQARQIESRDQKIADLKAKIADLEKSVKDAKQENRAGRRFAEAIAPIDSYREAAKQAIEAKAIADLQPDRYLAASRKYAREAYDAIAKGDYWEAKQAKHKELLNHFLYREAMKAKDFVSSVERFADKLASPNRQSAIGKAGQDFLGQIQNLLGKFRFVDLFKNPAVGATEPLPDFLARMREEGQDMPMAPWLMDAAGKPYRSLTVSELRDVQTAMKMLDHVARNINKITIEGRKVAEEKLAADLDQALVDNVKGGQRNTGDRVSDDARSFLQKMKDRVGNLDISVLRPEFLFKRLDGLKDFGVWHDAFWNKYNDAQDHLTNLRESIFPELMDIARGKWGKSLDERVYIKSIDATLSKNDIFSILLNCGNDSNMEKLERGGLRFKVDGASIPLTEPVRQELFSHLNAEDIDKANRILKMISKLKPEAEALALKRNGVAPQWIEARPYQTPNGTLEGGYFPLVYDPRWSAAGEKQADAQTVDQMFNRYATASTRQGYTKERTNFSAPLSLDWQTVVMRHLDNVMVDISHWQFATEAQRLLKNPAVKESLISNMGELYHKNLMDWVRFTVNQDAMGREATDGIDRFRRTMRNNVGTAVLGFRVMNAVVETGITPLLALQQAHPESVYKGMMAYMRSPGEATRFAESASDYMKNINVEYDRQITEMWNDIRGDHSLMGDIKKWAILSRVAIWKIGAVMSWHAGFLDAQRQGLDGDAAVRVADSLYRKIQEAGRPGDLSASERNPYMRELTMFMGPTIIQFNNYMEAAHAIGDKGLNAQTAGKALTVLLAGHLVNSVLFELLRAKGPQDDEKWPAWLMARASLGLFDGVPILNQYTRYLEAKATGEGGGEPKLIPALQAGKDTIDALQKSYEAVKGEADVLSALKKDARAIGEFTGLPMTQGIITGQYIWDRMTGEYTPAHPWSHVTDVFFARRKK